MTERVSTVGCHNDRAHALYRSPGGVRNLRWAGHVARFGYRIVASRLDSTDHTKEMKFIQISFVATHKSYATNRRFTVQR